ncbi:hypothetical protein [Flavobacterium sp. UBA4197]|uniref:hypothetical protein n=1 Tax=Flavobacterium sp. UBA4197 TaxID=1946546 RepID=UPI00257A654F|nr:hypothetical protein [Flavobacterium sp. UBA4197]HRB72442.1 hypothetical protein [Flavobacterium sp.]
MIGVTIPEETGAGEFQKPREIAIGIAAMQRGRRTSPQDLLNRLALEVKPDDIIILNCLIRYANENDSGYRVVTESRFLDLDPGFYPFVGEEVNWNDLPLNYRGEDNLNNYEAENVIFFNLGEVNEDIYVYFRDSPTPYDFTDTSLIYLIRVRSFGIDYLYMYGGLPVLIGIDWEPLALDDLQLISCSNRPDVLFPNYAGLPVFTDNVEAVTIGGLFDGDLYKINESGTYHLAVAKAVIKSSRLVCEFSPSGPAMSSRVSFENFLNRKFSANVKWGDGVETNVNEQTYISASHTYSLENTFTANFEIIKSDLINNITCAIEGKESSQRLTSVSGLNEFPELRELVLNDNLLTEIEYLSLPAKLVKIDLKNNFLSVNSVNGVLSMLVGFGLTNGYVDVSGENNATLDAAGGVYKTLLIGNGWTVIANE